MSEDDLKYLPPKLERDCRDMGLVDSPQWFSVNGGTHEVSTWIDDASQIRAEMAYRGWVLLGRPDSETVREANEDA